MRNHILVSGLTILSAMNVLARGAHLDEIVVRSKYNPSIEKYVVLSGGNKLTFSHPVNGQLLNLEVLSRTSSGWRVANFTHNEKTNRYQLYAISTVPYQKLGYSQAQVEQCAASPVTDAVQTAAGALKHQSQVEQVAQQLKGKGIFDSSCSKEPFSKVIDQYYLGVAKFLVPSQKPVQAGFAQCLSDLGFADLAEEIQKRLEARVLKRDDPKLSMVCSESAEDFAFDEATNRLEMSYDNQADTISNYLAHELLHVANCGLHKPVNDLVKCCASPDGGRSCKDANRTAISVRESVLNESALRSKKPEAGYQFALQKMDTGIIGQCSVVQRDIFNILTNSTQTAANAATNQNPNIAALDFSGPRNLPGRDGDDDQQGAGPAMRLADAGNGASESRSAAQSQPSRAFEPSPFFQTASRAPASLTTFKPAEEYLNASASQIPKKAQAQLEKFVENVNDKLAALTPKVLETAKAEAAKSQSEQAPTAPQQTSNSDTTAPSGRSDSDARSRAEARLQSAIAPENEPFAKGVILAAIGIKSMPDDPNVSVRAANLENIFPLTPDRPIEIPNPFSSTESSERSQSSQSAQSRPSAAGAKPKSAAASKAAAAPAAGADVAPIASAKTAGTTAAQAQASAAATSKAVAATGQSSSSAAKGTQAATAPTSAQTQKSGAAAPSASSKSTPATKQAATTSPQKSPGTQPGAQPNEKPNAQAAAQPALPAEPAQPTAQPTTQQPTQGQASAQSPNGSGAAASATDARKPAAVPSLLKVPAGKLLQQLNDPGFQQSLQKQGIQIRGADGKIIGASQNPKLTFRMDSTGQLVPVTSQP